MSRPGGEREREDRRNKPKKWTGKRKETQDGKITKKKDIPRESAICRSSPVLQLCQAGRRSRWFDRIVAFEVVVQPQVAAWIKARGHAISSLYQPPTHPTALKSGRRSRRQFQFQPRPWLLAAGRSLFSLERERRLSLPVVNLAGLFEVLCEIMQ